VIVFGIIIAANLVQRGSSIDQYQIADANMPHENQISGLTFYRYDPNTNKLCFAASVDSLRAENATIGFFKTAAAKVLKVKKFRLQFSEPLMSATPTTLRPGVLPEATISGKNRLKELFGQLADVRERWGVGVDLGNITEVTIDDFYCRILDANAIRLTVRSRRAVVDSRWPLMTLQGHVVITCANGSALDSSNITWDIQKRRFVTDGIYLLRQGDKRISGKGICVDSELNIADTKIASYR
jgi:hypothetical protein